MSSPQRIRVWDLPTRFFHWVLAALVLFSFISGRTGGSWLEWHMRSGYTILALLIFRLAWGLVGSDTARFSHFVRGPRAAIGYVRETWAARHPTIVGHNPLGGWMVVFMIAVLVVQASTGLFADDEIATQGPLTGKVSNAFVARMTAIHHYNQWVIAIVVALHVIAIALYWMRLRANLVGPMISGWMALPAGVRPPEPVHRSAIGAAVLLALAAAFVYWLVTIYPKA